MTVILKPGDIMSEMRDLERRVRILENTGRVSLGATISKGAISIDDGTTTLVVLGKQADGTYGVWVGTGAQLAQIIASSGAIVAPGGISTGQSNMHIFTGIADPAASAVEGDLWFNG